MIRFSLSLVYSLSGLEGSVLRQLTVFVIPDMWTVFSYGKCRNRGFKAWFLLAAIQVASCGFRALFCAPLKDAKHSLFNRCASPLASKVYA